MNPPLLLNIALLKKIAKEAGGIAACMPQNDWKRAYYDLAHGAELLWRKLDEVNHSCGHGKDKHD